MRVYVGIEKREDLGEEHDLNVRNVESAIRFQSPLDVIWMDDTPQPSERFDNHLLVFILH
jgi:hypothetical protein